jgi:hypothetical protein
VAYKTIPFGAPELLNDAALSAASDLIFAFQPKPAGGDFSAIFQVVGTVSSLVSNLRVSLDGGTTWTEVVAAASFLATGTVIYTLTPAIAGALYEIHATTLTGSQNFYVCSN